MRHVLAEFFDIGLLPAAARQRPAYRVDVVHVNGQRVDVLFVGFDQLSLNNAIADIRQF